MNYYNENDPKAVAWLRELIKEGYISEGVVDERSILDVQPRDLAEYNQCHFFAGIGGWSYALRLAGIPDDEPIWTGSCPCQPFSNAGKQLGTADERHLWPVFFNLIRECNPPKVFGEQVASKAGRDWLAGVFADLEGMDYQRAGADLCAAGIDAPHIRQRLYWVGHTTSNGREQWGTESSGRGIVSGCRTSGMDNPHSNGAERARGAQQITELGCETSGLGHTSLPESTRLGSQCQLLHGPAAWSAATALQCTDGKTRRIEPGSFPLAHGVSGRVGLLRGYGNAIVPQVAAAFIAAFHEALHDVRSDVLMSDPMF